MCVSTSRIVVATVLKADKMRIKTVLQTIFRCRRCVLSRRGSCQTVDVQSKTGVMQAQQSYRICSRRRCRSPPKAILILIACLIACWTYSFQRSSWSKTTPSSLVVGDGSTVFPFMTIQPQSYSLLFLVIYISSVFSAVKQDPVRRAHVSIQGISSDQILARFSSAKRPTYQRKQSSIKVDISLQELTG